MRPSAREALAALPRFPPFPRGLDGLSAVTLWQEPVGRTYLLAGDLDEALAHLRAAARACPTMNNQFTWVHAHEELGEALGAKGDTNGACDELRVVLSYWGQAKPRSVTADNARAQMRRLACPK